MKKQIYMDHAATTPVDVEVKKAMDPYFSEYFGNPGSLHDLGVKAKQALDESREEIAKILNCDSFEIIFTGSGTESINLAIKGCLKALKNKGKHIITSKVEHHAVLHTCEFLEKQGYEVTYLDVDEFGMVNPEDVKKAIKDDTILISIMYVNNEIGTMMPIEEIGKIAKENKILFHTDACQASGFFDLDVKKLNIDMMTLNGSKVYGPKGIGLLYVRRGVVLQPLIHGGGQERKLRAGTENIPSIVGFAKALSVAQENKYKEVARLTELRDRLKKGLLKIPNSRLNGHPKKRSPNNVNISFLEIEGEALLLHLNEKGIYASSGSACTSQSLEPSHVIIALGVPYEYAHGSIRFTIGKSTTKEDVDYVIKTMPEIVDKLRNISPFKTEQKDLIKAEAKWQQK